MEVLFIVLGVVAVVFLLTRKGGSEVNSALKNRLELVENELRRLRKVLDGAGLEGTPETQKKRNATKPDTRPETKPDVVIPAIPAAHHGKELEPVFSTSVKADDTATEDQLPIVNPSTVVAEAEAIASSGPPPAYVFNQEKIDAVFAWLIENWFYAVAALSLALAGIFFVQYGIEQGILTPKMRVTSAILFGLILIGVAEYVRRKSGDGENSHTAFIPSIFAGAGLVSMFGGVLAGRQLYDVIETYPAFGALVAIGVLAVVLGWFYGPLLSIIGILGATAAPFLVGGGSGLAYLLFYYFAAIAIAGLLIDTVKRWAWLSSLSLLFTFIASLLIYIESGHEVNYLAFAMIVTGATVIIPERSFWPRHQGIRIFQPIAEMLRSGKVTEWPEFPARLVAGTMVPTLLITMYVAGQGATEYWLAIAVISVLILVTVYWFENAPALESFILLPPVVLLYEIAAEGILGGDAYHAFRSGINRVPETLWPLDATWLLGLAAVGTLVLALKSTKPTPLSRIWMASAAILTPAATIALEVFWIPADVMGTGAWTLHVIAIAAVLTLLAERFARREGPTLGVALFVLGALTMISLALVLVLTKTALTLALAVMVVIAAWLDKRFDLKPLTWFVQLGGVLAGWRLVIDPGVEWAYTSPFLEMMLNFAGVIALFAVAWKFLKERDRMGGLVVMESAVWTLSGIFASVVIFRLIENNSLGDAPISHWAFGLYASIWMLSCGNQLWRLKIGGPLKSLRIVLAVLTGGLALLLIGLALTFLNPLLGGGFFSNEVVGPIIFNSLLVAYGLPAALFALGAIKLTHLPIWMTKTFTIASAFMSIIYVGLTIRHFWVGPDLSVYGVTDGEQYSYTVAMLLGSAGLLFIAFRRRSASLRKLAMIGVGLTIAKVFLIDMAGLAGLIRVFSFLILGLSLAGLAWVNRWMVAKIAEEAVGEEPTEPAP